jgi:hypothetical protein
MGLKILVYQDGVFIHKIIRGDPERAFRDLERFMVLKYGIDNGHTRRR